MGKVVSFTNLTVDGVMQAPGRPDDADAARAYESAIARTGNAAEPAFLERRRGSP